jgi:hypothetical protein
MYGTREPDMVVKRYCSELTQKQSVVMELTRHSSRLVVENRLCLKRAEMHSMVLAQYHGNTRWAAAWIDGVGPGSQRSWHL